MKKLYTLLAAALALFSLGSPTAMAQVTEITPGYYVIGGVRGSTEYNKFVCDTYGFAYAKELSAAPTEATAETAAYIWEVATASEADGTQYYTLKNMLTGRYLKTSDFLTTTDEVVTTYSLPHAPDADALFNIVSSNGSYTHLGSRAEQYCLMQYGGPNTTENKYAFHEVSVPAHFDVYCAYLNLFGADGLTEGEYTIGTAPGCVSEEVYAQLQNAATAYQGLTSESTEEEYTSALTQLQEAAAALEAARTPSPGYYVIRGHRASGGATSGLLYDNNGTVSSQSMDVPSTITADNAINVWKLTASTSDGGLQYYTLQNVLTGNYMQRSGNFKTSSAASTANSGRIAFPAATGRLFLLQDGGGYIGHVDGSGNLVHWQDANSTYNQFEIYDVEVAASVFCDIAYTNLFGTSGFAESNYVVGTDPGCISQDVLDQLKAASDAYVALNESSSDEDINKVTELLKAAATALATGRVQLTPGYYIIRGTRSTSGSYVDALYDNGGTVKVTDNTSLPNPMTADLSQYIWKAEEVDVAGTTYYTLRNLSTGKYMQGADNSTAFTTQDEATSESQYFTLPTTGDGRLLFMHTANGYKCNVASGQSVVGWWDDSDASNRFTFEAVPVIEVREVSYATLYVNFAYEMPEGLTGSAITGVEKSGDVKVATCDWQYPAGTTVPALEAILIKGEPGTYYGTKTTGGTGVENNLLRGVLTTQTPAAEDGYVYYKLSRNAETNKIGFWWGADGGGIFEIPANRGYLALPPTLAEVNLAGFAIEPGSDITGINSPTLSTSEQPAAIYTLSGVRVNSSTTDGLPAGIYIVGGKKVLVK